MRFRLKISTVRLLALVMATVLALPFFSLKGGIGLTAWLSPFILLNSVFLLKSWVALNSLGVIVLIISIFRKRWFCRTLCPVGLGCDSVSKLSHRKNFSLHQIPRLGPIIAISSLGASIVGFPLFILLDPMAIFNGFFSIFSSPVSAAVIVSFLGLPLLLAIHLFFPGIWCSRLCPLGGLLDLFARLKRPISRLGTEAPAANKSVTTMKERRLFIAGGTGLVAGLMIPRWLQSAPSGYFRPPASLSPELFNTLCVRCGNCIKACPTKIIVHHTGPNNLTAWMTPEVSFQNNGYCLEDCNLCGTVCPSGAITQFNVKAKKELVMGGVEIGLEKCLLTQLTECDRCKAICSYKAIKIVPGDSPMTMKPEVDVQKCVGCGACAAVCPPEIILMIPPCN